MTDENDKSALITEIRKRIKYLTETEEIPIEEKIEIARRALEKMGSEEQEEAVVQ